VVATRPRGAAGGPAATARHRARDVIDRPAVRAGVAALYTTRRSGSGLGGWRHVFGCSNDDPAFPQPRTPIAKYIPI
jgi:hypothetical protein